MQVVIALGSNLGESSNTLAQATKTIEQLEQVRLLKQAPLYRTKPWGYADQPDFVNSAILVDTSLELHELYRKLAQIELDFGRKRLFKNGPRTLDLDIIWAQDTKLNDDQLTIPHPRAQERAFVLVPLSDLDPELKFPDTGLTVAQALSQLPPSELAGVTPLTNQQ
ncbi:MAG: 2-amino-4-hydroxy-6-hydroxymethyldihydropteridine diphosphokinase [Anaerobiospirillum sp.]|nr:2-amino-4-hydroxy-6-hydroxymethyldihydropteridine diphosphokinase [Anaerobiospirillum sp.]